MARRLATSPTASPASMSSDYSLSSLGNYLALEALLTIYKMAITALVKYVVVQIIHGWDQLFGRSAAVQVAPEVVDPVAAAPLAPGVVDPAAAAAVALGPVTHEAAEPVSPAAPGVVDPAAAAAVAPRHVAPVAAESVAPAAPDVVDHAAPEGITQAAGLKEIVQPSH